MRKHVVAWRILFCLLLALPAIQGLLLLATMDFAGSVQHGWIGRIGALSPALTILIAAVVERVQPKRFLAANLLAWAMGGLAVAVMVGVVPEVQFTGALLTYMALYSAFCIAAFDRGDAKELTKAGTGMRVLALLLSAGSFGLWTMVSLSYMDSSFSGPDGDYRGLFLVPGILASVVGTPVWLISFHMRAQYAGSNGTP